MPTSEDSVRHPAIYDPELTVTGFTTPNREADANTTGCKVHLPADELAALKRKCKVANPV